MSDWNDSITNKVFSIITGDGEKFSPLWNPEEKSFDFNTSEFNFIGKPGTLIDRKEVSGAKIPLIFTFQGSDVLAVSAKFEQSSKDKRYWIVNHPYYGTINGQPVSLNRNDKSYGSVTFSVEFWESITDISPTKAKSVVEAITLNSIKINTNSATIYASKSIPKPADISTTKNNVEVSTSFIDKVAKNKEVLAEQYSEYQAKKNKTLSDLDNLTEQPISVISQINDFVTTPSTFPISVETRLSLYEAIFKQLKEVLSINDSKTNKAYFEAVGASIIGGICVSLVNPLAIDYITRSNTLSAAIRLQNIYSSYMLSLDDSMIGFESINNNFFPSGELQNTVQEVVLNTLDNLFFVAFGAMQERVVYTDKDTNLIKLTHKYIGLDEEDKNIETFRQINGIKNKSVFIVKKNTRITYLV